jgi:hypothetical protein
MKHPMKPLESEAGVVVVSRVSAEIGSLARISTSTSQDHSNESKSLISSERPKHGNERSSTGKESARQ